MRIIWFFSGLMALTLGIIGTVLPMMPTVPFILLAAWCFAKSSASFHRYLLNHKHFGPSIRAWQERRAIPRRGKILALIMLSISVPVSVVVLWQVHWALCMVLIAVVTAVITWIWRFPDA